MAKLETKTSPEEAATPDMAARVVAALSAGTRQEDVIAQYGLTVPQFQKIILERNRLLRAQMDEWLADQSGEQEETWPRLKQVIEENHTSYGRVFSD